MKKLVSGFPLLAGVIGLVAMLWLPAILVTAWWMISARAGSFYFPPLAEILAVLWSDLTTGPLGYYVFVSLRNLVLGLGAAIVIGVGLGLVIGEIAWLRRVSAPTLNFLRAVPPASIVPIVIIAMGVGVAPKVFIIGLGCLWPILLNTIDGVRGMPESVRDTVRAYRIPPLQRIFKVALPAAMPQILAGVRISLAVGLVLIVISEFFGADSGIGFYIIDSSNRFSLRQAWAGTVLVGILGYLSSALFLVVERRVLAWYFQDATGGRSATGGNAA